MPRYRPKMVSPSLREYPICDCVHSYSIARMRTKSPPPPPPQKKKFPMVSNKTQTTLRRPKNIFCFINNIRMTTSNYFEYAKNPHVNDILTKKIPESKISTPKNPPITPVTCTRAPSVGIKSFLVYCIVT